MKKINQNIILKLTFTILLNTVFLFYSFAQNKITKGYIDLSNYNFNTEKALKLNGEWEFYYSKIITPDDFLKSPPPKKKYVLVPKLWNNTTVDNEKLSPTATATYRLKIKVNPSTRSLTLRTERLFSAFDIYVNDSLIARHGKIKTKNQDEIPGLETLNSVFIVPDTIFYITINISNYSHRKGGIQSEIVLGNTSEIYNWSRLRKSKELFVIGIMLIMAFYNIGLFILWKKNVAALFFGLLMASVLIHLSVNDEVLLVYFFNISNVEALYKIDFITNYTTLLFFGLYFWAARPTYYNKIFMLTVAVSLTILSLFVLFTSEYIYTHTLLAFEIAVLIYVPYIITRIVKAAIKKEQNALIELVGTVILFLTAINDILYENAVINSGYILWLGLSIFIIIQSYAVAKKYTYLYNYTDDMNAMMTKVDNIKASILKHTGTSIIKPLEIVSTGNNATRGLIISSENGNELNTKSYYSKYVYDDYNTFPEKIINETIKSNQIINIANAYEKEGSIDKKYIDDYKPKSILCCPLSISEKSKTIIYLENSLQANYFSEKNEKVLALLSNQIINLIENYEKYQELENLNIELEETIEVRTVEVMQQREELKTQNEEIERQNKHLNTIFNDISFQNKEITDSINYAKRIQKALLPEKKTLNDAFPDNFIFFNPKETLSGDFYWAYNQKKKNIKYFSVADCTGHGVPGALMSIIGNNLLFSQATENENIKPAQILDRIQSEITVKLKQNILSESKDGMDLAIIAYDEKNSIIEFAAARNPIILIRNNKITEYKGDRMSIGGAAHARINKNSQFTNIKIQIQKDDIIYSFSDGYADQIGGAHGRKFMKNRFYETLLLIHKDDLNIQKQKLEEIFNKWKAENLQIDDVLVAGIKF